MESALQKIDNENQYVVKDLVGLDTFTDNFTHISHR